MSCTKNFLRQIEDIPPEQRQREINKIESSNKYQITVGERIFELLEKLDSEGKPEIAGKMFRAVLENKIDFKTCLKAWHILGMVFYYDLVELRDSYDGENISGVLDESLKFNGVMELTDQVEIFEDSLKESKPKSTKDIFRNKENSNNFYVDPEKQQVPKGKLTFLGKIIVEYGMN